MNRSRREELELRLAEGGAAALEHDAELREWVEGDDDALALFEAMVLLDQSFEAMSDATLEDGAADAPDELVAALLGRPELVDKPVPVRATRGFRPSWPRLRWPSRIGWRLQMGVAVAALLVVSSYLLTHLDVSEAPTEQHVVVFPQSPLPARSEPPARQQQIPESEEDQPAERKAAKSEKLRALGFVGAASADDAPASSEPTEEQLSEIKSWEARDASAFGDAVDGLQAESKRKNHEENLGQAEGRSRSDKDDEATPFPSGSPLLDSRRIADSSPVGAKELEKIPTARDSWAHLDTVPGVQTDRINVGGNDFDGSIVGGRAKDEAAQKEMDANLPADAAPHDLSSAEAFLAARHQTDGLTFQDAAGYWRNPWLPGDPELRFLAARMDELAAHLPTGLHDLARRPDLPLDPPESGALALYLHADQTMTTGPTRVALRLGVRAADAWAGRRTAMNLAVVLHLPPVAEEIPAETAASLRALLEALAEAHDLGDRFTLLVAGRPGGVLVPADEFRLGSVMMAARSLLDSEAPSDPAEVMDRALDLGMDRALDFETALAAAGELVQPGNGDGDDDSSPVGSSAVLVVITGKDADSLAGSTMRAHALAVGGVRVSAFGVGPEAASGDVAAQLARLADAGQGSRRLVARPSDALPAIEDELAQAARAVARAVRLRIRPAPGVRLVGVFDSEPLSAPAADRVREAEQALDLRLAHKLGIESDRGEDEEGIQIVVPALYAGDAMTLLVDLVAPGPGPLADVTVRYKDLVRMDNGVARARFELAYGEVPEVPVGPLQVSVVKSLLAQEVKQCLDEAANDLEGASSQAVTSATKTLGTCRDLLRGMAALVPALAGDPDLQRDVHMLSGYLQALAADPNSDQVSAVRQSLHYAGKLKTLPRPTEQP